ncbi:hypothetical protein MTO96_018370 [Rhipicephalus appendiculatus]
MTAATAPAFVIWEPGKVSRLKPEIWGRKPCSSSGVSSLSSSSKLQYSSEFSSPASLVENVLLSLLHWSSLCRLESDATQSPSSSLCTVLGAVASTESSSPSQRLVLEPLAPPDVAAAWSFIRL